MTWVVHERVGSRKWKLTDDGSARGTIILVCATDDPARDVSAAKDTAPGTTPAASSSQGLWVSIKDAGYALVISPRFMAPLPPRASVAAMSTS